MKLPKSLTTVTRLSKMLALCMFIFFPVLGFFLGMNYQKVITSQESSSQYNVHTTETSTPTQSVKKPPSTEGVMCTQEAKQCPDGSYVGRSGPTCEFAPCPH